MKSGDMDRRKKSEAKEPEGQSVFLNYQNTDFRKKCLQLSSSFVPVKGYKKASRFPEASKKDFLLLLLYSKLYYE
jgi:hypothetical protein